MQTSSEPGTWRPGPPASQLRRAARTDSRTIDTVMALTSSLLWASYFVAAMYVVYCNSYILEDPSGASTYSTVVSSGGGSPQGLPISALQHTYNRFYYFFFPEGFDIAAYLPAALRVVLFSAAATAATYYLAVHVHNGGELLMVLAWILGIWSESYWLTSYTSRNTIHQHTVRGLQHQHPAHTQVVVMDDRVPSVPSWMWLTVAIITGFFSGILCKVKDISDGKLQYGKHLLRSLQKLDTKNASRAQRAYRKPYAGVGYRLYIIIPFCTGQWFSFILQNGWRGIVVENGIIVLTLGMIGYTMLSISFLKERVRRSSRPGRLRYVSRREISDYNAASSDENANPANRATLKSGSANNSEERLSNVVRRDTLRIEEEDMGDGVDIIDLTSRLFTTSFGAVALGVVGLNIVVTSLAIPLLKALFSLNALVSTVGIVVELLVYELA